MGEFRGSLAPQSKKANLRWLFSPLAHPGRFELPTPGFVVRCSIQLSYGCVGDAVDSTTSQNARGKRYRRRRKAGALPALGPALSKGRTEGIAGALRAILVTLERCMKSFQLARRGMTRGPHRGALNVGESSENPRNLMNSLHISGGRGSGTKAA